MGIQEKDWQDIMDLAKATAVTTLGGPSGRDYAAEAQDVAQETMIQLLEMGEDIENPFALAATIASRKAMTYKKKESRRREIEQDSGDDINRNLSSQFTGGDPLEILEAEDTLLELNELTPTLRNTLMAYYIDGLTYEEIANIEGRTEAVIRKRISRAKKLLLENKNNG